jgi:hypothetical protein
MTIPHARGAVNVDGALKAQRTRPTRPERAGNRPTKLRARATGAAPWEPSSPRALPTKSTPCASDRALTRIDTAQVQRNG